MKERLAGAGESSANRGCPPALVAIESACFVTRSGRWQRLASVVAALGAAWYTAPNPRTAARGALRSSSEATDANVRDLYLSHCGRRGRDGWTPPRRAPRYALHRRRGHPTRRGEGAGGRR